jgi:hypothetical protein
VLNLLSHQRLQRQVLHRLVQWMTIFRFKCFLR